MWRALSFIVALIIFAPGVAAAQQPCTTDARRVVDELYRHMLERNADPGSDNWIQELQSGRSTVRQVARAILASPEHQQRFYRTENGEGTPYIRAIGTYYRHILGRQPDDNGARSYAQMAANRGVNAVVESIMASNEYNNEFGDWGVPGSGGMRFCAPNNSTAATAPVDSDPNQVTQADARRFRAMDINGDGSVSLNEWRGSRQSFRVHDWNGDNVLAGNEIRVGSFRDGQTLEDEDFDRAETFENLDWNNNNRVDRAEWHGSDDAFDWLDRNNDNVLTRAELGANVNGRGRGVGANNGNNNGNGNGGLNRNAPVGTSGETVVVSSREQWTDTGIMVNAGDILMFDADGSIRMSTNGNDLAGPGGSTTGRRATDSPVPTAPAGGLLARIGNRAAVYVGDRRALRVPVSGRLYLGVNDDFLDDNQGQYRVTVSFQNR